MKYKNFLLTLGVVLAGTDYLEAKEHKVVEEDGEDTRIIRKGPSPLFLEIDLCKDMNRPDWNVGCSVSNDACSG